MNRSESIAELATALSKFQGEVSNPPNSKTVNTGSFSYKYSPLDEILSLIRPLLSNNGLSMVQAPIMKDGLVGVTTTLLHKSGEWMEFEPILLKLDKQSAQGAGSAITYSRRYAISSILGISSEDDDDANSIEPEKGNNKSHTNQNDIGTGTNLASDKQIELINKLLKQKEYTEDSINAYIQKAFSKKGLDVIDKNEASEIITMLNDLKKK